MKKLLSVLFVALFAAASVQAVAAEGQSPSLEKKEMKKVHKRPRAHVKKTAHRRVVHKRVAHKRVAHKRIAHKRVAHRKVVHKAAPKQDQK